MFLLTNIFANDLSMFQYIQILWHWTLYCLYHTCSWLVYYSYRKIRNCKRTQSNINKSSQSFQHKGPSCIYALGHSLTYTLKQNNVVLVLGLLWWFSGACGVLLAEFSYILQEPTKDPWLCSLSYAKICTDSAMSVSS